MRGLPGRRRGATVSVAVSTAAFCAALAAVSGHGTLAASDRHLLNVFGSYHVRWLSIVARWCTNLGSVPVVLVAATATIALCLVHRRATEALLILMSIAVTGGAVRIVKELVGRNGPHPHAHLGLNSGKAFPSGHSAQAVACYFALAWILNRRTVSRRRRSAVWIAAGTLAGVVGWSRVYFRVHWPSDVLAGWAVAAFVLTILIVAVPRLRSRPPPLSRVGVAA